MRIKKSSKPIMMETKKESPKIGTLRGHLPVIEWNIRDVCKWMAEVRNLGGIPIFKTKYGGVPFKRDGENCVLAVGWDTKVKGKSVWICGIPDKLYKEFEEKPADFLTVYNMCPADLKKEIQKAPPPS